MYTQIATKLIIIGAAAFLTGWKLPKIKNPITTVVDSVTSSDSEVVVSGGDYEKAIKEIDKEVEKSGGGKNGVLLLLEQGAIYRSAAATNLSIPKKAKQDNLEDLTPQQYFLTRSNQALDAAELRVNEYELAAKTSVTSEISALLTNQASRDYKGRAYDKVMMNTYKALNYLTLGDFDAARVEINRSLQRQRDAVEQNAREIEQAQEAAAQSSEAGDKEYDVDRAKSDPKTNGALAEIEAEVSNRILATYGDYVNPFAVFLDGLFFLHAGQDASDLERARKSLERVAGMAQDNAYVDADLEAAALARRPENVTYVIFETGRAPQRDETKIEIPTFLVTSDISYVGAAFPKLVYNDDYRASLTAESNGKTYSSSVLSNMDSVVSQDFKNDWPVVVTTTLASSGAKGAADAAVQNVASNSFSYTGQLLTKAATLGVQSKLNKADTRTWASLPKAFCYMRLPTPVDGNLTLAAGGTQKNVQVVPNEVNVVYVKLNDPTSPMITSQFIFPKVIL